MSSSFYKDPEYKRKQSEITRKKWKEGVFDFKRKVYPERTCKNPDCQNKFTPTAKNPKIFCSLHCARIIVNSIRARKISYCINCGKKTKVSGYKYCSNRCSTNHKYLVFIDKWRSGKISGNTGINCKTISPHIRHYLRRKYADKCALCSWSEKNPVTKRVPLEIDHIDGNAENNKEENLRLICPNCHSLTPNYRNLNKGNGRTWRLKDNNNSDWLSYS